MYNVYRHQCHQLPDHQGLKILVGSAGSQRLWAKARWMHCTIVGSQKSHHYSLWQLIGTKLNYYTGISLWSSEAPEGWVVGRWGCKSENYLTHPDLVQSELNQSRPLQCIAWKWVGEPDFIALHCTEQQQCNKLWVICIEMFCTLHYLAIAQCTLHRITMFCIIHIVHILHIVHCTVHTHTGSLGNAMTWNAVLIHPPESQLTHPSSFLPDSRSRIA